EVRGVVASYIGEERTAQRFSVPVDYAAFMVTVGGRESTDSDWVEVLDAPSVAIATENGCSIFDNSRNESPEAEGIWMTIGYSGDKHPHLLCCDREHPLFGLVVEGEDNHPWFSGFRSMTGLSASFLGYLQEYLRRRLDRDLRAFPKFSVAKWFDCEKAGPGK